LKFQKAVKADLNSIMNIVRQAQSYFKDHEINQWQDNYPNLETIINDIKINTVYVLLKENIVVGIATVIFGLEKNYEYIYNGEWVNNAEYVVIHRMAIDPNYKGIGLSSIIIKNIEQICLEKGIHSIYLC